MKFLLFLYFFTAFSYAQTTKVVARKACNVNESCPANSGGSGLEWSGIRIYDWWDHDSNSATLDRLGWNQCTKATVANSGSASVVNVDNCTCDSNFTKSPPNCVGQTSCACVCNLPCTGNFRRNSSRCRCECSLSSSDCPSGYVLDTSSCACRCGNVCVGENMRLDHECVCKCSLRSSDCPAGTYLGVTALQGCACLPEDTSTPPPICTEQSCTDTRPCQVGTGTERGTGRTECPSGDCNITSWILAGVQ